MRKSYDLTIPHADGDFRLGISLAKSFDEIQSFKMGYEGRPIKQIRVVPRNPNIDTISSVKDIEKIVPFGDVESLIDIGDEKYIPVDKKVVKEMFPSTPLMKVVSIIPSSLITFDMLDGSHYFVNVQRIKKSKNRCVNPDDVELYNLIHLGLKEKQLSIVVKYTAVHSEKNAIIYVSRGGLMISNLIGSNLQRSANEDRLLREQTVKSSLDDVDKIANMKMFSRLIKTKKSESLPEIRDTYSDKLSVLVKESKRKFEESLANKKNGISKTDDDDDDIIISRRPKVSPSLMRLQRSGSESE